MNLEEEIQTKSFSSPMLKAGLNIMFTSYWLQDRWSGLFKEYDLSQAQYNVLRILRGQKGRPINLCDVQSRMIEKNSNTTRLVEKLRLKGLLDRIQCEKNRRKVEISITEDGLLLLKKIDPHLQKREKEIFKNLSKKDAETLNTILNKMRN